MSSTAYRELKEVLSLIALKETFYNQQKCCYQSTFLDTTKLAHRLRLFLLKHCRLNTAPRTYSLGPLAKPQSPENPSLLSLKHCFLCQNINSLSRGMV